MKILIIKIDLMANWVHSLKEKRMVVKSITSKLQNKFNISVAEIDNQDLHQRITIGIVGIFLDTKIGHSMSENIIDFVESSTDAQIINIEKELNYY